MAEPQYNFSSTTPPAPAGKILCGFQQDGGLVVENISMTVPIMQGDAGAGGQAGVVPAPAAGDAAAGKFLKADGTFAAPPKIELQTNGTDNASQTKLNLIAGANVTLTPDTVGGVTIAASAIGGGSSGALISGVGSPFSGKFLQGLTVGGSSIAFAKAVTVGSLLIVSFSSESAIGSIGVTDTLGTSYSLIKAESGASVHMAVYYGIAPSSGANTVTVTGASSFSRVGVAEFSGLPGVSIDVSISIANTAGTNPEPISVTTSGVNELLFLAMGGFHSADTFAVAGGFTLDSQTNGSDANAIAHAFVGSAATYTATITMSGGADQSVLILIAFKSTAGSSTPGVDGDFYIDLSSKALWGPRTAGAYNLIGTLN